MNLDEEWRRKGATLSDKTARKKYGLTQEEILAAIDTGQLHYRVSSIHGNPWLRLLRREVEDLMNTYDDSQHRRRRATAELGPRRQGTETATSSARRTGGAPSCTPCRPE